MCLCVTQLLFIALFFTKRSYMHQLSYDFKFTLRAQDNISRILQHNFLGVDEPFADQYWRWCNAESKEQYDFMDVLKYHNAHPNYGQFVNSKTPSSYHKDFLSKNECNSLYQPTVLPGTIYYSPVGETDAYYRAPKIILGDDSHEVL